MLTTPPKFVPTLTEVVPPGAHLDLQRGAPTSAPEPAHTAPVANSPARLGDAAMLRIEQRVLQDVTDRVMSLLDATLEKQVREAVANVALAHAQAIARDILPTIETVVTHTLETALREALAKELGDESGYR
jgi:hypothetical protein